MLGHGAMKLFNIAMTGIEKIEEGQGGHNKKKESAWHEL